jgi:hypothetical protein
MTKNVQYRARREIPDTRRCVFSNRCNSTAGGVEGRSEHAALMAHQRPWCPPIWMIRSVFPHAHGRVEMIHHAHDTIAVGRPPHSIHIVAVRAEHVEERTVVYVENKRVPVGDGDGDALAGRVDAHVVHEVVEVGVPEWRSVGRPCDHPAVVASGHDHVGAAVGAEMMVDTRNGGAVNHGNVLRRRVEAEVGADGCDECIAETSESSEDEAVTRFLERRMRPANHPSPHGVERRF